MNTPTTPAPTTAAEVAAANWNWLLNELTKASTAAEHTAAEWAVWARDALALRARMPGLPRYIDPDGIEPMHPIGDPHDYRRMREAIDRHVAAADHYAAAYARHAAALGNALADALETHYPPPADLPADPTGPAAGGAS